MRLSCLLLTLFLTAGACSTSEPMMSDSSGSSTEQPAGDEPMQRIALREPFAIERGEKALFPDDEVEIRFDGIANDSRCPANVDCIRAGEATARFTLIEADGTEQPFTLEMPGLMMEMQDMEAYQFQQVDRFSVALLLLQPYPGLADEEEMPVTATVELRRTMR